MSPARPGKRETLNLRIKSEERALIDYAARSLGKNRTDFVLDAARRAAEDAMLDRTILTVSAKAYAEFVARLDKPPKPNERLRRTMRTRAPWELAWRFRLPSLSPTITSFPISTQALSRSTTGSSAARAPIRRAEPRARL